MKELFKYIIIALVVALMPACSEDYLDINTDPNEPTEVSPDLALPVAQHLSATYHYSASGRRTNTLGNLMMANWSQSDGFAWYPDEFKYNVTSSFYQDIFNVAYRLPLKQYNTLDRPDDPTYDYYTAIAMIMKSYHFQILVDAYGDVPYSEALQRSKKATPKYDKAEDIYADLIVKLSAAIELLNNPSELAMEPGNDDIMFGGDIESWIRFANTIKLRILTRLSDMPDKQSYITEQLNAISGGFITADVGVNPGYVAETDKQSPLWDNYGWSPTGADLMNWRATCATDYVLAKLQGFNDPRIDYIYEKPATGHLGVPQGLLDYDTPILDQYMYDKVSNIGPGLLKSASMDAIIVTLAECYFNQAELALKGLITGNVKDFYQKAIEASFSYLGTPGAVAYYSQNKPMVGWDATLAADKLEAIITQKWIALNGIDAIQSWFDYNRTGYPSDVPLPLNYSATTDRPVRLRYPASELASNSANIPSQPDVFTEKIFWAK